MFGVRIFFEVEFVKIREPGGGRGWHANFLPSNHPLNDMDFSVLVGAEGKNSRIPGFDRKELRAKLALAITANFINHRTQDEAAVQEISGVAFIFNQKFFKDLREDTGIDLENIVYYRDDTHYFIMTAKKDSLLEKGVLRQVLEYMNICAVFNLKWGRIYYLAAANAMANIVGINDSIIKLWYPSVIGSY